jgi:hypothetical protein
MQEDDSDRADLEENNGDFVTEQAGYVTTKEMVTAMIEAGRSLDATRMGDYDYDEKAGEEEATPDPTRGPNFDIVDAQKMQERLKRRIKLAKADPKEGSGEKETPGGEIQGQQAAKDDTKKPPATEEPPAKT